MSSFIDKIIERDIDSVNEHLPKKRVLLKDLLDADEPAYETKDGKMSAFKKDELIAIASDVPTEFHSEIMLPIVILRRMDLGPGMYAIAGSKVELFIVHRAIQKVVGHVDLDWSGFQSWTANERLARPEVRVLRKTLQSTTCIGFTTAFEREKN